MEKELIAAAESDIQNIVYSFRRKKVMLDSDRYRILRYLFR